MLQQFTNRLYYNNNNGEEVEKLAEANTLSLIIHNPNLHHSFNSSFNLYTFFVSINIKQQAVKLVNKPTYPSFTIPPNIVWSSGYDQIISQCPFQKKI